jgi:hypothetical protein
MTNHAGARSLTTVVRAPALLDESVANSLSAVVDMLGYDRVKFIAQIGGMVNASTLDVFAVESNESNLGNATNITGAALVQVANTANNSVQIIDIHRPAKRYVGVYSNAGTANVTLLGILAERFRGTGVMPAAQPSGAQYVAIQAN